jgi:hypothetical protein
MAQHKSNAYVGLPYEPGSETSKAAAESMLDHAENIAKRMWVWIRAKGELGATADEIYISLKIGGSGNTTTARMAELKHSGLVKRPPGEPTRPTQRNRQAVVWMATDVDFDAHYKKGPYWEAWQKGQKWLRDNKPTDAEFSVAFNEMRERHKKDPFSDETSDVLAWVRRKFDF